MSDSVQPHRQQPTRLRGPWDSPGKNTGVGCHFLLQCMKVESESEIAQSRPHGLQPTRLLYPWDFPGKSTGVGCHCLFLCVRIWMSKYLFECRYIRSKKLSHKSTKHIKIPQVETTYGVAKSRTQLSDWTATDIYIYSTDREIQNLKSLTTLNYHVQKNSLIEHNLSSVQGVKAEFKKFYDFHENRHC